MTIRNLFEWTCAVASYVLTLCLTRFTLGIAPLGILSTILHPSIGGLSPLSFLLTNPFVVATDALMLTWPLLFRKSNTLTAIAVLLLSLSLQLSCWVQTPNICTQSGTDANFKY